jgi:signal transduction histidine kinase/ActR/RegA family two-component response regulator
VPSPHPGDAEIPADPLVPLDSDGVSARILDAAMEAAEMGPWRYAFADHVCYLSPRAQVLYGIEGSHFIRDEAAVQRLLHPDDLAGVKQALRIATDPRGDGRYAVEYRARRPQGGWRWLSVWGLVEFDHGGEQRRPLTMTGASRDITAGKRAEMFAEAQKRSLELVVSGAPLSEVLTYLTRIVERQSDEQSVAAILFLDEEGRLRNGASPNLPAEYVAAIDGLKAEPHIGTCSAAASTCRVVVTPDIENDPGWATIKHLPLGLGLRAAWSQPILSRDGRVLGTFGTYFPTCRMPSLAERDAVEILSRTAALAIERARVDEALRDSERRMRESDRQKDEFLAALSHELRNPLAPLKTALHLLRTDPGAPSPWPLVDTMDRQVAQLVRLVDDLLEVSRISRGTLELRKAPVDVADVIALAVETSEPVIHAAGQELRLERPGAPVWVLGDPVRLAQVLSNLLNNAAKYTEPGGHITLRADVEADAVEVSVTDTGVGIEPAAIPGLFELFARGPHAERRHRQGLGVGLALARRLAEMHDGSLVGVSDGPGHGSRFTLRLPVISPAAVDAVEPGGTQDLRVRVLPAARVLAVDDNVDAADLTATLLTALGCEVQCAYDGPTALAAAARLQPDLILLDIGLGDMSGYDVCRRIRAEAWGARTLIVAVTGWGQERDRAATELAGFDAHLVKPIDFESLAGFVRSAGASRGSAAAAGRDAPR